MAFSERQRQILKKTKLFPKQEPEADGVEKTLQIDSSKKAMGPLSETENQILNLLAKGNSVKEVALKRKTTPATINGQIDIIRDKLGVNTALQLVITGIGKGIISLEEAVDGFNPQLVITRLTDLERDRLHALAKNNGAKSSNKEIADIEKLSERTIEREFRVIYRKLNIQKLPSRVKRIRAAVMYLAAQRNGLLPENNNSREKTEIPLIEQ